MLVVVKHLVDGLDEFSAQDYVNNDQNSEPGRCGKVNPSQIPLSLTIEVPTAPPARIKTKEDPEADSETFAEVGVVELGVRLLLRVFLLELIHVHCEGYKRHDEVTGV